LACATGVCVGVLWIVSIEDSLLFGTIQTTLEMRTHVFGQSLESVSASWTPNNECPVVSLTGFTVALVIVIGSLSPQANDLRLSCTQHRPTMHHRGACSWTRSLIGITAIICAIAFGVERPWYPQEHNIDGNTQWHLVQYATVSQSATRDSVALTVMREQNKSVSLSRNLHAPLPTYAMQHMSRRRLLYTTSPSTQASSTAEADEVAPVVSETEVHPLLGSGPTASDLWPAYWSALLWWNIGCSVVVLDAVVRLASCYQYELDVRRETKRKMYALNPFEVQPAKTQVDTTSSHAYAHATSCIQWTLLSVFLLYYGLERLAHQPHTQQGYTAWLLCTDLFALGFACAACCIYFFSQTQWHHRARATC
jgi:hypothetical protein